MPIINPLDLAKEAAEKKKKQQHKSSSSSSKKTSSSSKTSVSNLKQNKGPISSTYKKQTASQKLKDYTVSSIKKQTKKKNTSTPVLPNEVKNAVTAASAIATALTPGIPSAAKSFIPKATSTALETSNQNKIKRSIQEAEKAISSAKTDAEKKEAQQALFDAKNPLSLFDRTLSEENQDIIRQAKQDWITAENSRGKVDDTLIDKAQEEAHRLAEYARAEKGFSGGKSGNQYLLPDLSDDEAEFMTDDAKQQLRMQKRIYDLSKESGDQQGMQMASEAADAIRLSSSSWDIQKLRESKDKEPTVKKTDAYGREIYTPTQLEAEA